jgi:archaellum component FlaC
MLLNIQQELNNIKTMVSKLEQNIQQVAILIHNNPKNNTLMPTNQTPLPPIQSLPKQPEQQPVTNDNQNDETPPTDAMQSLATLTNEVKSILQHLNNNTERTNALGEYLKQISSMSPSSSTSRNFQEFLGQHF